MCRHTLAAGEGPAWVTNQNAALRAATEQQLPIVVDVWAEWCAPCREMDRTTWSDARVVEALHASVPLKIDADAAATFVTFYGVDSFPTVLFLDGAGNELGRLTGYLSPGELLEHFALVRAGYAAWLLDSPSKDPLAQVRAGRFLLRAGNAGEAARRLKRASGKLPPGQRGPVLIDLARAQGGSGQAGAAARTLRDLAEAADVPQADRVQALRLLVALETELGHADAAEKAKEQLARAEAGTD